MLTPCTPDSMELDGMDNSAMLLDGAPSNRDEVVLHLNELINPYQAAIRCRNITLRVIII